MKSPIFVRGEGAKLVDSNGEFWLDGASGTFNVPMGYGNEEITKQLEQGVSLPFLSSPFVARQMEEVVSKLCELAPGDLTHGSARDITGSSANERAIKAAQKASGESDVLSLFLSHHGQSSWMTAISGNAYRRRDIIDSRSPHSLKVPAPYCYRCHFKARYPSCGFLCVESINDYIEYASSGSIACFIVEPVLGNGGNIVPPPGYFEQLRKLCDERNICLIADEVQTGVGRTGYFFGSEALGLEPDMAVLAKGLGGVGLPIAAVIHREEYDVLESYEHASTGAGGLLGLSAAATTIDAVSDPEFLADIRRRGEILGEMLEELSHRYRVIGDVRGLGMMWGIEMVDPDTGAPAPELAMSIIESAFEQHNLVLRISRPPNRGNVIKVRPPLVTTEEELEQIVLRIDTTLAEFTGTQRKAQHAIGGL
ncbi:MAG: aminotransferase class III-fold pyridoxal phosphate-dependent enzyme [Erythrobacter sp.]|nr:aminotransferase class III-fold pyridoxal phosphate-dependent enzyme [Erythrobacter sp.]